MVKQSSAPADIRSVPIARVGSRIEAVWSNRCPVPGRRHRPNRSIGGQGHASGGPCESRSRHLGIKSAFPDVSIGRVLLQQVPFSQVNDGEFEEGRDAVHRLATQKDGIVGSNVGQNARYGCRLPNIAIAWVNVTRTALPGMWITAYRCPGLTRDGPKSEPEVQRTVRGGPMDGQVALDPRLIHGHGPCAGCNTTPLAV